MTANALSAATQPRLSRLSPSGRTETGATGAVATGILLVTALKKTLGRIGAGVILAGLLAATAHGQQEDEASSLDTFNIPDDVALLAPTDPNVRNNNRLRRGPTPGISSSAEPCMRLSRILR